MNNTAIIIVAAGSASRFGGIKQLLHFNNKSLLQHAIDEALASGAAQVIVVTGANTNAIEKEITLHEARLIVNNNWTEGMAAGIVAGVRAAIDFDYNVQNIIISVCDQPFISASLFRDLFEALEQNAKHIVAAAYSDTVGTPALFTQKYFDALLALQGDEGAKKILRANPNDLITIAFPQGNIDIDTKEDYQRLIDDQQHIL